MIILNLIFNKYFWIVVCIATFTFFAYHNFNWFPEKERKDFTIKIYYKSGRVDTKTFNLPESTYFSLMSNGNRSNLTYIRYHNDKPFGNEFGRLGMNAEDFEIVSIK